MNTALVIALMAVAISLFSVFLALRSAERKKQADTDGGASTSTIASSSDAGSSDCGSSDGGGCD